MRAPWFHVNRRLICGKKCGFRHIRIRVDRGPFLERPGNFSVSKANFKIQTFWIVAQFLARKPVNFASLLTDSFIVLVSKFLKLWPWMPTRQTQNSFPGPKSYRDFPETGPCIGLHCIKKNRLSPVSFFFARASRAARANRLLLLVLHNKRMWERANQGKGGIKLV